MIAKLKIAGYKSIKNQEVPLGHLIFYWEVMVWVKVTSFQYSL